MKHKTAVTFFGIAAGLLSLVLLLTLAFTVPTYLKFKAVGPQLFRPPGNFANFLEIYRLLFFALFPAIALLCGAGAWLVLRDFPDAGVQDKLAK